MELSAKQKAEEVQAALDGRHQTLIHCYCNRMLVLPIIRDYEYSVVACDCGRGWYEKALSHGHDGSWPTRTAGG